MGIRMPFLLLVRFELIHFMNFCQNASVKIPLSKYHEEVKLFKV
jgi:hypothetical protein